MLMLAPYLVDVNQTSESHIRPACVCGQCSELIGRDIRDVLGARLITVLTALEPTAVRADVFAAI
jgi:hypothetical protein